MVKMLYWIDVNVFLKIWFLLPDPCLLDKLFYSFDKWIAEQYLYGDDEDDWN